MIVINGISRTFPSRRTTRAWLKKAGRIRENPHFFGSRICTSQLRITTSRILRMTQRTRAVQWLQFCTLSADDSERFAVEITRPYTRGGDVEGTPYDPRLGALRTRKNVSYVVKRTTIAPVTLDTLDLKSRSSIANTTTSPSRSSDVSAPAVTARGSSRIMPSG